MARSCWLVAVVVVLGGCGGESESGEAAEEEVVSLTAAELGVQATKPAAEWLSEAPYAGADRQNGANQAVFCRACHSLEQGGRTMMGPPLHGFFGRRAGALPEFDYSAAFGDVDFVWTPRALDAWLANPGKFLPGNRMIFAGVSSQNDRADLIAYLLETTMNDNDP